MEPNIHNADISHPGYGANFFVFASTFHPFYAAISSYSGEGSQTRQSLQLSHLPCFSTKNKSISLMANETETPQFASSFAFYLLFMGVLVSYHIPVSLSFPPSPTDTLSQLTDIHLPHLLPPHQPRLCRRLSQRYARLQPRRSILLDDSTRRGRRRHTAKR